MQTYRAYIMDKAFRNFQEFNADDDGDALHKAEKLVEGSAVELWEGARFIGTLKPARRCAGKVAPYIREHASLSH